MKIVHLSYEDVKGGASTAAWRLHRGLLKLGIDSTMRVRVKYSGHSSVELFTPPLTPHLRLKRFFRRWQIQRLKHGTQGIQPFSDVRSESGGTECSGLDSYDVVNLHWASDFVDLPYLFEWLPKEIPIVVTLHDMNLFTGGCHYNQGCDRFTHQCGDCPQLTNRQSNDASTKIWQQKQKSYQARLPNKLHFVANSHWTAEQAKRSSLLRELPVGVIHYGLDTAAFAPHSKQHAREFLGIPAGMPVVMFGAASVEDDRKGIQYLQPAISSLATKPFLLTFGAGQPVGLESFTGLHLGAVSNERLLAVAYNAADIFVIPSLQEAFGQTALEAMACGTPVIGFQTGGIPDMVVDGVTGKLCPTGDSVALSKAIATLIADETARQTMGTNARALVEQSFALTRQAQKYADLYQRLGN